MKIQKYNSYDEYKSIQKETYKNKLLKSPNRSFATNKELNIIVNALKEKSDLSFGICQGVRSGFEVEYLRNYLDIEVVGTEIGDIPPEQKNVIQMDFHDYNAEWDSKADFIYTNSLDHSYDPIKALTVWSRYLKPNGYFFITWTMSHSEKNMNNEYGDIFGASLKEYITLLEKFGTVVRKTKFKRLKFKNCFVIQVSDIKG